MKKIDPAHLIPMDQFLSSEPIAIDLAYADANHSRNIFDEALYHDKARLWAHKDLAKIILLTARMLHKKYNWTLELKDCLRTSNSQQAMQETALVKAHPEWREGPSRLLAPPGAGAHPRAMAIDVCVLDNDGNEIDMGTPFDHLDHESARDYIHFPEQILRNRKNLEDAFTQSAETLKFPFLPYSAEWWDFRFPYDYYIEYEALQDEDLPPQMQMTDKVDNNIANFDQEHFDKLAEDILYRVDEAF